MPCTNGSWPPLTVEIVIPALRQKPVERLVHSLCLNTQPPDIITVVSNEVEPFPAPAGATVRLLRFASKEYAIGEYDVALRQNCGVWAAQCDTIIIQGDDQIAPPSMIEDSLHVLGDGEYIWGNHRLIDFNRDPEHIRLMPKELGISRENPVPPARHGFQSCYGGMLAIRTDFIREVGAFDMAFMGRHGSEDQQLGYRLMARKRENTVLISEPPFSWHPIELRDGDTRAREQWLMPVTNGCGDHLLSETTISGMRFLFCSRCPYRRFSDEPEKLFRDEVIVAFRPELVTTTSIWLTV